MSGNIPGGNFSRGNSPGGSLMGGKFPGGSFPGENFPRTEYNMRKILCMILEETFSLVAMVSCWRFIWVMNSSDQRRD